MLVSGGAGMLGVPTVEALAVAGHPEHLGDDLLTGAGSTPRSRTCGARAGAATSARVVATALRSDAVVAQCTTGYHRNKLACETVIAESKGRRQYCAPPSFTI